MLGLVGHVFAPAARKAELARIGHYCATESMLVRDVGTGRSDAAAPPETGRDTLANNHRAVLADSQQADCGDYGVFLTLDLPQYQSNDRVIPFTEHPLRRWAVDEMRLRRFAPVAPDCHIYHVVRLVTAEERGDEDRWLVSHKPDFDDWTLAPRHGSGHARSGCIFCGNAIPRRAR